jgi:type I restriction enzyme S subunit
VLKESYHSEYTYYNVKFNIGKLKRLGEGTTFAEISKTALARVELVFPQSKSEQTKIAEVLSTVDRAIEQTEALIAKQQRIKTGLMQDLLTRGIDKNGNLRSEETHEFKDSPLGRIPVEWECSSLSWFVPSAEYGISTSLGEFGYPVLRMNNLFEGEAELSDLKYTSLPVPEALWLRLGDVLFNRTNSWEHVGRTGIWRGQADKATFASYLVRLNPDHEKLIPELLNAWLNWHPTQIAMRCLATPAVQQVNINPTNLRAIHAAFPCSLDEQHAIAERLSATRRAISSHRDCLNKLRLLKTALMQDLLTGEVRVTPLIAKQRKAVTA